MSGEPWEIPSLGRNRGNDTVHVVRRTWYGEGAGEALSGTSAQFIGLGVWPVGDYAHHIVMVII